MRRFSRKEKILLCVAAGIMFVVLTDKFVLSGFRTRLKELEGRIKTEEARLKKDLVIDKNKSKISAVYNDYLPYLELSRQDDKQTMAELLKEVERLAKDSGASVVNLSPQDLPQVSRGHKKYLADLRMEATNEKLLAFIFGLQESKLLVKLDKLAVVPKDEQASVLTVDATLSISIP